MKKALVFLLFVSVYSCNYFEAEKIASEDILNEELKTFNWNTVDAYPAFASCESLTTKGDRKHCFENTLASHIANSFLEQRFIVTQTISDTVVLEFTISEKGVLALNHIRVDSLTAHEIPSIKKILQESLETLPDIYPAIKRDQPVKTTFTIPLILSVNE
ncbi:hypothetical protein ES676_02935 [Bizionia saleffrena]|uniref:TonB C-terminal domain-containing protein n=1 Tax=Bizionia saleffrena TaxID=291189 RepID=A0A8H2QFJ3_9FLAO|nr:hypothetical protein [Bizionia saleffrena]TYB78181.1 hypothetical protein ES676_02935 [Bizionia saleffrena]